MPKMASAAHPDPRTTNIEVLRNIHGSLKWFWQLIMGFALINAISGGYQTVFPLNRSVHRNFTPLVLGSLVFLPLFLRFYFGDVRYLDERYLEHRRWQPLDRYFADLSSKLSRLRFWLDVLLLFMHGLFFMVMALSISSFPRFFGSVDRPPSDEHGLPRRERTIGPRVQ